MSYTCSPVAVGMGDISLLLPGMDVIATSTEMPSCLGLSVPPHGTTSVPFRSSHCILSGPGNHPGELRLPPPVTDPIPEACLAQLWAVLSDPDPDAIARLIGPPWRPRLAARPRRLRVARPAGVVLLRGCGCRH